MTITAIWGIELHANCPRCKEYVNLLDYVDFWDGRKLDIGETGTERSRNVDVICPNCFEEFIADLEY